MRLDKVKIGTCFHCKEKMVVVSKMQYYCSVECRHAHHAQNKRKTKVTVRRDLFGYVREVA